MFKFALLDVNKFHTCAHIVSHLFIYLLPYLLKAEADMHYIIQPWLHFMELHPLKKHYFVTDCPWGEFQM